MKSLSPNDNLRHTDISLGLFFHSFISLVLMVCAKSDKSQAGELLSNAKKITELTMTMPYSLDFWVNPYLQTQKL